MFGFSFAAEKFVENAKPRPGVEMDHALIFSSSDLERLSNPHCIVQDKYVSQYEMAVPLNKGGLEGIKAFIPLLMFCEAGKPGAFLAEGTIIGISTGEDIHPKFHATVLSAPEDLHSLLAPVEIILTIGGTKENPEFGILKVKNFFYGFTVPGKLQDFCGEDKETSPDTLPIPCRLGRRRTALPNTSHIENLDAEVITPTLTVREPMVDHDFTVRAKFGLPGGNIKDSCKPISPGMFTDSRLDRMNGFVLNLTSETNTQLTPGMKLGIVMPPNEAPGAAVIMMDETLITKTPTQLFVTENQGKYYGYPVEVPNLLNHLDSIVAAYLGPKFQSDIDLPITSGGLPETAEATIQSLLTLSRKNALPRLQNFALTGPVIPEGVENFVSLGRSLILSLPPQSDILTIHGSLALLLGQEHVLSAQIHDPITLKLNEVNFIEIKFNASTITAAGLTSVPPGDSRFLRLNNVFANPNLKASI